MTRPRQAAEWQAKIVIHRKGMNDKLITPTLHADERWNAEAQLEGIIEFLPAWFPGCTFEIIEPLRRVDQVIEHFMVGDSWSHFLCPKCLTIIPQAIGRSEHARRCTPVQKEDQS